MIAHWLNVHVWGPMWPNVFAPSAFTLAAVFWSHVRTRLHIRAGHQATTAAVATQLAEHRKQVSEQLTTHCSDIKEHVSTVAAAQGPAAERVVPDATSRGRRRSGSEL